MLGLDFFNIRILIVIALIRFLVKGEYGEVLLNPLDILLVGWAVSAIVFYTILWQTPGAFLRLSGQMLDATGIYFTARLFIRSSDDIHRIIRSLAVIIIILGCLLIYEWFNGKNIFAWMGSIPTFVMFRHGYFRFQGPFIHPLLLGSFVTPLFPIMIYLLSVSRKDKLLSSTAVGRGMEKLTVSQIHMRCRDTGADSSRSIKVCLWGEAISLRLLKSRRIDEIEGEVLENI